MFDTGASSGVDKLGDNLKQATKSSDNVFFTPLGKTDVANNVAKVHHKVREPATMISTHVPGHCKQLSHQGELRYHHHSKSNPHL